MTATAHALVGTAIASSVREPVLSGSLIVSSHFLLDLIPHWDFGTNWRKRPKHITGGIAVADTVFGFILAIVVFSGTLSVPAIVIAVSLALVPDWIEAPWYIFFAHKDKRTLTENASVFERMSYAVYKFENLFHTRAELPAGLLTQVGTVAFFLLLLS